MSCTHKNTFVQGEGITPGLCYAPGCLRGLMCTWAERPGRIRWLWSQLQNCHIEDDFCSHLSMKGCEGHRWYTEQHVWWLGCAFLRRYRNQHQDHVELTKRLETAIEQGLVGALDGTGQLTRRHDHRTPELRLEAAEIAEHVYKTKGNSWLLYLLGGLGTADAMRIMGCRPHVLEFYRDRVANAVRSWALKPPRDYEAPASLL